jgi:hypothetical protein
MIESMRTPEPSSMATPDQDDGYVETIALLQEEIARLEAELHAREEASQALAAEGGRSDHERAGGEVMLGREVDQLRLELSAREETIGLLMEQLRLVEEAEAANKVEWEQLEQWVAEVEERVERQEGAGAHRVVEGSENHRREEEKAARARHEQERAGWAGERRKLEEQVASLEGMIAASAANQGSTGQQAALAAVEAENRRLRERFLELETTYRVELQSNKERLDRSLQERDDARGELRSCRDDREREGREYEMAIASLRAKISRAALGVPGTAAATSQAMEGNPALEADIRIREFRQHLQEIHCLETKARDAQRLGARLSRLWRKTAPA